MIWMAYSIIITIICMYLAIRVYRLRKSLKKILEDLAEIESRIPVLKP